MVKRSNSLSRSLRIPEGSKQTRPNVKSQNGKFRPFRQGTLDAFCGLYAIVNAMLRLAPDWFCENEDEVNLLFQTMLKRATEICGVSTICLNGLDGHDLLVVAKTAVRFMKRREINFGILTPDSTKAERKFQRSIETYDQQSSSIIIHIEDKDRNHWSVLKTVGRKKATLFDSDGLNSIALSKCEPWMVIRLE